MLIKRLRLICCRNYESLDFAPHERLNVIMGDNAQGKTNVLEALFICAFGKSHRTARDAELISYDANGAAIKLELDTALGERKIELRLGRGEGKRVLIDGKAANVTELLGVFNVVLFSPEDLFIIKQGPDVRRRLMDRSLSQLYPAYFSRLMHYNRAMKQRNQLLKDGAQTDVIRPFTLQLAQSGSEIMRFRSEYIDELSTLARHMHERMSDGRERLDVTYAPCADCPDFEPGRLFDVMSGAIREDMMRGYTTVGPHRDDFDLVLDDRMLKLYGSQGQQRTAALSLKLAELELIARHKKESPVLLLDDVLSELDKKRQSMLLTLAAGSQTVLTCTSLDGLDGMDEELACVFKCENGRLEKCVSGNTDTVAVI